MTDNDTTNESESGMSSIDATRDVSRMFDLLKRPERRAVLHVFHESKIDSIELVELGERVSNRIAEADETTVRSSLHHHHLPKLADLELIDYEKRSGTIRRRDDIDELLAVLVE